MTSLTMKRIQLPIDVVHKVQNSTSDDTFSYVDDDDGKRKIVKWTYDITPVGAFSTGEVYIINWKSKPVLAAKMWTGTKLREGEVKALETLGWYYGKNDEAPWIFYKWWKGDQYKTIKKLQDTEAFKNAVKQGSFEAFAKKIAELLYKARMEKLKNKLAMGFVNVDNVYFDDDCDEAVFMDYNYFTIKKDQEDIDELVEEWEEKDATARYIDLTIRNINEIKASAM